ncbi:hypothetical protein AAG906_019439 [Vitis piasezkii]
MSTPSRSQSSVMGGEDYFIWHEKMERRQQENDWQMEESSLNHQMQSNEGASSTQVSRKRRLGRRSHLSDAMRACQRL